ncbi:hypothetical protein ACWKWA_03555 [Dermacoccus abyssi]
MKAVVSQLLAFLRKGDQSIVPMYQHLSSWHGADCAQQCSDIIRANSRPSLGLHFTGSAVHVAMDRSTNTSAEPGLINGPQPVTTVTPLLVGLAARLATLPAGEQEPGDGFSPKIRNGFLTNGDAEGPRQSKLVLEPAELLAGATTEGARR